MSRPQLRISVSKRRQLRIGESQNAERRIERCAVFSEADRMTYLADQLGNNITDFQLF